MGVDTREIEAPPRAGGEPGVALVQCEGITKRFGAVHALRGVGFELRSGEVHALLGQNGAGKSTLIKVLAGGIEHDEGRLLLGGEEVDFRTPADSRAAGISVVYQELSLVPSMSISANLCLGSEPHNRLGFVRRREAVRQAREMLARLGLTLDPRAIVERLPFAYRQMTEIAKALSGDVRVLVLDEPTSSLSEAESEILFEAIKEVTARGVGVIYITHRLSEVFQISQRVTVIRDGANVGTFDTAETDLHSLVAAIIGPEHENLRRDEVEALALGDPKDVNGAGATITALPARRPAADRHGGTPVLELRDVGNDRLVGVDLAVGAGEIVGLAGMVGSGRTEILETIFGLRRVASGEMRLEDRPVKFRRPTDAIRRGVALVPEDRHVQGVALEHSIERNLALTRLSDDLGRLGAFRRGASYDRAKAAIATLGIKAPGPDARVQDLSGGNQQKVVFGKWHDPRPSLLLLDEPTVGVDIGAREELYGIIRRIAGEGSGVLTVCSELAELLLICDRIAIVAGGRIVQSIRRDEIENEEHLHRIVQEAEGTIARPDHHDEDTRPFEEERPS
ncbi:MAG: transporter related protein [Conexibacter sp.]|nr:transporter related protein [Conexibacter sp.]